MNWRISILAFLCCGNLAGAQQFDRLIARTNDILQTQRIDAWSWYQGESLRYEVTPLAGTNSISIPTNAVPIWYVTDARIENYYVFLTGTVAQTTGPVRYTLPSTLSALPAGLYQSFAVVYGGDPTGQPPVLVLDRTQVKIERNANYSGIFVGPVTPTNLYPLDASTPVMDTFWLANADRLRAAIGVENATDLWQRISHLESITDQSMTNEALLRAQADAAISNAISQVAGDVAGASNALSNALNAEIMQRAADVNHLNSQIGSLVISGGVAVVMGGGWYSAEYADGIAFSPVARSAISSNAVMQIADDFTVLRNWSDMTAVDYYASLESERNLNNVPVHWSVNKPSYATIDTNGFVTSLANGDVKVIANFGRFVLREELQTIVTGDLVVDYQLPGPTQYWRNVLYTSLVDRISNSVYNIALYFNHETTNYYWFGTNSPMVGVDLSAAPVWNSRWNSKHNNGILISPRIVLTAEHSLMGVGTRFRFLTQGGEIVERTAITNAIIIGSNGEFTDLQINLLDTAITNISPIRLLDRNWHNYIRSADLRGARVRAYRTEDGLLMYASSGYFFPHFDFDKVGRIVTYMYADQNPIRPNEPWFNKFHRQLTGGDSGGPQMILHGNEPILMGVIRYNDGGVARWVWQVEDEINLAVAQICPSCDPVDWYEGFTNYIPTVPLMK